MNDRIGQPSMNKRRASALTRNYNCCMKCKKHRQKCEGYPCKRCLEHKYTCEIGPLNNRLANSANFVANSTAEEKEDQDVIPNDTILYTLESSCSSSRLIVLHKKVEKDNEYVYTTECEECDGKIRPMKESVYLGPITSVFQKMQEINTRLSIQDISRRKGLCLCCPSP